MPHDNGHNDGAYEDENLSDDNDDDGNNANNNDGKVKKHDEIQVRSIHCPSQDLDSPNFRISNNNQCNCQHHNMLPCIRETIRGTTQADDDVFNLIGINYWEERLEQAADNLDDEGRLTNDRNRFRLYSAAWGQMVYTCPEKYNVFYEGSRYKRKRVKLPNCVESIIRSLYPEYSGRYIGYKRR